MSEINSMQKQTLYQSKHDTQICMSLCRKLGFQQKSMLKYLQQNKTNKLTNNNKTIQTIQTIQTIKTIKTTKYNTNI